MADWSVFGNGKKWKVLNRGVSASGRKSPVFLSGVSASRKISAAQRCFGIVKNQQCCTTMFRHREKSISAAQRCFGIVKNQSVLHSGVSAS
jgi:hypothetical protein